MRGYMNVKFIVPFIYIIIITDNLIAFHARE